MVIGLNSYENSRSADYSTTNEAKHKSIFGGIPNVLATNSCQSNVAKNGCSKKYNADKDTFYAAHLSPPQPGIF